MPERNAPSGVNDKRLAILKRVAEGDVQLQYFGDDGQEIYKSTCRRVPRADYCWLMRNRLIRQSREGRYPVFQIEVTDEGLAALTSEAGSGV